ncbi:uncharacterized protein LOC132722094 [Ruditapes philippinarum]|uniref:uncharacterized protein LOC132722094 n=1 Tax=Ruditapes philippinarum TaxID=129788 RepID=UPI00295B2CA4|nr:uncharacterized protein LOC132722094 [Ruditapes philippinarum]
MYYSIYLIVMLRLFLLISCILFANGSSFEERLKILEIIVDKQQAEMDLLKQANIELKQENLQLNRDNTELKKRVKELEVDVSNLKGEGMHNNQSYESHINAAMHDNVDSINRSRKLETSDWHGTPNVQNDRNTHGIASLSKKELLQSERIAFHVYLSSNKCFNDHQIIEYDTEVLDTGNGYNEHDGIYIVPESGIYVFTWTFIADLAEYAVTEIVVNGATQGWTISDGSIQRLLYNPSSGLVLARVNAGDHVFIRRVQGLGCTAYSDQYVQPTFSGWQLSP